MEEVKLFEMPVLGFLGFPALALDSVATYALLSYLFHGNETWERPGALSYSLEPTDKRRLLYAVSLPFQLVFWGAVAVNMNVNVGSLELVLGEFVSPAAVQALEKEGVRRPRQLLEAAKTPERKARLIRLLNRRVQGIDDLLERVELYTFKGIGSWNGYLLRLAGVKRIEDFHAWDAVGLHKRLHEVAAEKGHAPSWVPRVDMVRVWVLASRGA